MDTLTQAVATELEVIEGNWTLVYAAFGDIVRLDDMVQLDGRLDYRVIDAEPPHKENSTGFVTVQTVTGQKQRYYAQAFGMKWIQLEPQEQSALIVKRTELGKQ